MPRTSCHFGSFLTRSGRCKTADQGPFSLFRNSADSSPVALAREHEAFVAARSDFVAFPAVSTEAFRAEIGREAARIAGDVGARVSRNSPRDSAGSLRCWGSIQVHSQRRSRLLRRADHQISGRTIARQPVTRVAPHGHVHMNPYFPFGVCPKRKLARSIFGLCSRSSTKQLVTR